jgi:hypothetical protein
MIREGVAMAAYWTDIYEQHFQRHFKKPFDIKVFQGPANAALKLGTYDWALGNRILYASIGLSDKLIQKEEEDFGEVMLVTDARDKEVPALFVNALFFILQHDIPLGSRFAIGGIGQMQPAFAKRVHKTALYFMLASDDDEKFNKVRRGDEFGRVYQAFFITAEEDRYLADYGPDEFEKRFEKLGDQRDRLVRPSCV